jgi:hypothetical protein
VVIARTTSSDVIFEPVVNIMISAQVDTVFLVDRFSEPLGYVSNNIRIVIEVIKVIPKENGQVWLDSFDDFFNETDTVMNVWND